MSKFKKMMILGSSLIVVGIFLLITNGGVSISDSASIAQMEQTFSTMQGIKSFSYLMIFGGLVSIIIGWIIKIK